MAHTQPPPPPPPAPPPPPPPRSRGTVEQRLKLRVTDGESVPPYILHGDDSEKAEFDFPKPAPQPGSISLRAVVGHFLGAPQSTRITAGKVYQILGRLRCLQHTLRNHNKGLSSMSPGFVSYWRQHMVNQLSVFGVHLDPELKPVKINGLDDLIKDVEKLYEESIEEARDLIGNGKVTFAGLSEVFRPDVYVKASIVSDTAPSVFRVIDSYAEERRSLFGSQKLFHLTLEMVVPMGEHFSVATFSEVFTAWHEGRPRPLADFAYQPVLASEHTLFLERAERGIEFSRGGAKYLAYTADSFFVHASRSRSNMTSTSISKAANSSHSRAGGRVMIDMARGASLGHHPCQGVDEATLSIIQLAGRYRQWASKRSQPDTNQSDSLLVWDEVPAEFRVTCWPALVGFSFTAKTWGHVLVSGLAEIQFQEQAFDQLVLSQERKKLIRAVVRCGTIPQTQDLISGKQGGLIFLLHGPPGVGKTLTAEAVAEVLHRPLYYVTMGELGVNPDDLENRLTDVLELCAEWDALAVLDEADVFLEKRSTSDLIRNAMVCVMLRILEYHPGILFLTTNRVKTLDPAFESRITIAIRYEELSRQGREQVWRSQLSGVAAADGIDYVRFAERKLNGRQIKNSVRLAMSLAMDQGIDLSESILDDVLEVTTLGRQNMEADDSWSMAD